MFQIYKRIKAKPLKGMRSAFEEKVYQCSKKQGFTIEYEPTELKYTLSYIPDFLLPNGVYVECKGYFAPEDRTKILSVIKSNPNIRLRLLFQKNNKISCNSNMTYGDWCNKHNIIWSIGAIIPLSWYNE